MKNFLLTSITRAFSILISVLCLLLVAEFLDSTETGKYYNIFTWMVFVSFFVRFGLDQIIIKLKNQSSANGLEIYKRLFFIQLIIYCFFMFLLIVFWELNNLFLSENYFYILILLSTVIFYSNNRLVSGYLIAIEKPGLGNFFAVGLLPLIFILIMLFNFFVAAKDINLNYLVILYFYSGFLVFVITNSIIFYYYQKIKKNKASFKIDRIIYLKSGEICISEWIVYNSNWFVFFLGALFVSKEVIGEFHIFARLVFFIATPLAIMVTIVSPLYARYFKKNYKLIQDVIYVGASISTLLATIACILLIIFSHEIFSLFGINNQENYNLFYLFIFSQFSLVIFGANSNILQMFGETRILLLLGFYSFFATVIMFFVINHYSALLAVPLSLILGYLIRNLAANYYLYKKYQLICFPSLSVIKDLVFLRFKKIDNIHKL